MNTIQTEYPETLSDYELLDSGDGEKLETIGGYTLIRPDPRVIWHKNDPKRWENADARFVRTSPESGNWDIRKKPPVDWTFRYESYQFSLHPTDFKHVGIFPEQAVNWERVKHAVNGKKCSVLNLFAYTGASSVVAAANGAYVTHVDSVKSTITWAHDNARRNHIPETAIRWIEDDAYKFVLREEKRGKQYDAVIMDPPRFGRGSKGEVWKLEEGLPKLLSSIKHILSPNPLFILINTYTADLSSIVLQNLLDDMMKHHRGVTTSGELATKETVGNRLLPQGIFGWWKNS